MTEARLQSVSILRKSVIHWRALFLSKEADIPEIQIGRDTE